MRNRVLRLLCFALFGGAATAQTPAFEAASLKPAKEPIERSMDPRVQGRRVVSVATALRDFIAFAFAVRADTIDGIPAWARSEHWDLEATAAQGDGALPLPIARQMMQAFLADRFQLQTHLETQEVAVYALVVDKGGPKFQAAAADATGGYSVTTAGNKGLHMEAKRTTMEQLARQLSGTAGRLVVDRTGLNGPYAFTLDWLPPDRTPAADANVDVVDMFTAVREQLGLKLEPVKAQMEKLIVDRVERPSGN